MLWALVVTVAALMAWVAYYERENRREFQQMIRKHNNDVREMNGNFRPLENDFVHLEERVDELAESVRDLSNEVRELLFQAGQAASYDDIDRARINRRLDSYYNESNELKHRVDSIEMNERLD